MKLVLSVGITVALLVVGGVATFFVLKDDAPTPSDAQVTVDRSDQQPIYRPLSPPFIVNFPVRGALRYLQMSLQVMAFDEDVIELVETRDPAIRNELIMLFSGQDYDSLGTSEGKEQLRKDVLVAVNEVLEMNPETGVQDVFFTAFVMQ